MKTIEFYSDIYGLADTVPILKTSEALPKWVSTLRSDYKQNQKEKTHLYRCPGIFDLFSTGYIVTAWHDMTINTDGENYRWEIPSQELAVLMSASQLAQSHSHKTVAKHLPRPQWAHPSVLKINTPWHVVAPKNVKFLITQVPYPDSYEFTALNGILDPGISTEINIQLIAVDLNNDKLTWNFVSGILPPGLTLGPNGIISGIIKPIYNILSVDDVWNDTFWNTNNYDRLEVQLHLRGNKEL